LDQSEDNVIFLLPFHGHEIHAVFSADVPCIQPINSCVAVLGMVSTEEIVVSTIEKLFWSCRQNYNNINASLNAEHYVTLPFLATLIS
jgi:hypothetical protein